MKKRIVKLCSVLFACLLVLSAFTACGGGVQDDGTNTLEIARWDMSQVNTARRQGTPLYRAVTEATGVEIEVLSLSNSAYDDRLNTMYTSLDLPDIFVSTAWDSPSRYRRWIRDGALVNLDEYVSETEYPNIYERLQQYDFLSKTLSYADGGHYAIPIAVDPIHVMYIRTDWIENLNEKLGSILAAEGLISSADVYDSDPDAYAEYEFSVPETLTEFYRLVYAFTYYDPDGDGVNNTYGYSCCSSNMWYNNWIFEAMSSADVHDSTYWGYVDDGEGGITASWVTEGNKKAVAFINKMYREGIMDPDYITLSEQECRTSFIQGNIGIYVENCYYNTILGSFMETYGVDMETAKTMFTCIVPPAGEDGQRGLRSDPGFWDGVSICGYLSERKIHLALTLLDYLLSDEAYELFTWGIEGIHYEVVNGERVSLLGKDSRGFNYTLETYDNAFPLGSLTNWMYAYISPHQSNYEEICGFLANAKANRKHDAFCLLQTDTYVEYDFAASNNAMEYFVGMIRDGNFYNSSAESGLAVGDDDWTALYGNYTSSYNAEWETFVSLYNDNWHGAEIVSELEEAYLNEFKQIYEEFWNRLYND